MHFNSRLTFPCQSLTATMVLGTCYRETGGGIEGIIYTHTHMLAIYVGVGVHILIKKEIK